MAEPASHEEPKGGLEARFQQVDDLQQLAAMQEEADTPAFTIDGRYEVNGTLGQGGMGTVYKARDTRLGRTIAIKTLLPQYLARTEASQRFFREAQALATLNHPNVLTLYDYGQEGDIHYLVMELGGRDVARVLEGHAGPLPLDAALRITVGIARALEYAHQHGIIHRDLKPANVLVGTPENPEDNAVKVMDFGLAKIQGATTLTAASAHLGTPQYMSPEQCLGQEAQEASDLYSLGVVLYELCTGVRPFDSDDPQAILTQHLNLPAPSPSIFNSSLPQALEALILRLLEKDPSRRPRSASEALRVLEAVRGGQRPAPGETTDPLHVASTSLLGQLPARSVLVGRWEELDNLKAQYEAVAAEGGGRLILVSGEPGVGKTRLVRDLGIHARQRGGMFLEGHFLRESDVPYAPWIEVLRAGLRGLEREEVSQLVGGHGEALSQIMPELVERAGPFPEAPRAAAEAQRQRLYDGIAGIIVGLSQRQPVVLLLDDYQWAPQLALLSHVTRRLADCRALVIAAYRAQEFTEQPVLVHERDEMNRARLFTQLTLRPLAEEQTAEMLAHAFGTPVADKLRGPVYARTRGNPYFVEEVLRSLVENGDVRRAADSAWEVTPDAEVRIPESLTLAVEGRVARLGDPAREVLLQAAVLGQEFNLTVLAGMMGRSAESLLDDVDRAVGARLLADRSSAGQERYAFDDDQVQEVLYKGLTSVRRRLLHLRAGGVTEALYSDRLDPHLEELARHFTEGNDPEKAADYSYRAGEKADHLFSWSRSIPFYRTALALWDDLGGHLERRAAVCERLGDACYKSTIDAPQAIEYFEKSLALYEQLGDRRKQATLHSQIGREWMASGNIQRTDFRKAAEHLDRARVILEEFPESMALGLVYSSLGVAYLSLLSFAQSLHWTQKGRELGERLGRPVLVADAAAHIGSALFWRGQTRDSLRTLEDGWNLASQHSFAFQSDYTRTMAIRNCRFLKKPREGIAWATRKPDYRTWASVPTDLGTASCSAMLGDLGDARQRLMERQRIFEASGQPASPLFLTTYGGVLVFEGLWGEAPGVLEDALHRSDAYGQSVSGFEAMLGLGQVCLMLSDYAQSQEWLLSAASRAQDCGALLMEFILAPALTDLYVHTNQLEKAQIHLARAQEILAQPEDWGGLPGGVYLAEGMLRAAQARWTEAEAAFQRAQAVYQKYELRWDEAKLYYEWGCALAGVGAGFKPAPTENTDHPFGAAQDTARTRSPRQSHGDVGCHGRGPVGGPLPGAAGGALRVIVLK